MDPGTSTASESAILTEAAQSKVVATPSPWVVPSALDEYTSALPSKSAAGKTLTIYAAGAAGGGDGLLLQ